MKRFEEQNVVVCQVACRQGLRHHDYIENKIRPLTKHSGLGLSERYLAGYSFNSAAGHTVWTRTVLVFTLTYPLEMGVFLFSWLLLMRTCRLPRCVNERFGSGILYPPGFRTPGPFPQRKLDSVDACMTFPDPRDGPVGEGRCPRIRGNWRGRKRRV